MNKSKFLKRSLAALLAILMVATMIPSAFAAEGDPVHQDLKITVDTYSATQTENGDYTVTVWDSNDVTINWAPIPGTTLKLVTGGKNPNVVLDLPHKLYLAENANIEGENVYSVTLREKKGSADAVDHKLTITVDSTIPDNDATLKAIRVDNTKGDYAIGYLTGSAVTGNLVELGANGIEAHAIKGEIDNDAETVTITLPFGMTPDDVGFLSSQISSAAAVFAPTSVHAKVTYTCTSKDDGKVTVTALTGAKNEYKVIFKQEQVFESFDNATNLSDLENVKGAGDVAGTLKVELVAANAELANINQWTAIQGKWIPTFEATENVKRIMGTSGDAQGEQSDVELAYAGTIAPFGEGVNYTNGATTTVATTDDFLKLITSGHANWNVSTAATKDHVYLLVRTAANPSGAFVEIALNAVAPPKTTARITEIQVDNTQSVTGIDADTRRISVTVDNKHNFQIGNTSDGNQDVNDPASNCYIHVTTDKPAVITLPNLIELGENGSVVGWHNANQGTLDTRHYISGINAKSGSFLLRVTGEDGSYEDYTINLTAGNPGIKLARVALIDGSGNVIASSTTGAAVTTPFELQVPYSYHAGLDLDDAIEAGAGKPFNGAYLYVYPAAGSEGAVVVPGNNGVIGKTNNKVEQTVDIGDDEEASKYALGGNDSPFENGATKLSNVWINKYTLNSDGTQETDTATDLAAFENILTLTVSNKGTNDVEVYQLKLTRAKPDQTAEITAATANTAMDDDYLFSVATTLGTQVKRGQSTPGAGQVQQEDIGQAYAGAVDDEGNELPVTVDQTSKTIKVQVPYDWDNDEDTLYLTGLTSAGKGVSRITGYTNNATSKYIGFNTLSLIEQEDQTVCGNDSAVVDNQYPNYARRGFTKLTTSPATAIDDNIVYVYSEAQYYDGAHPAPTPMKDATGDLDAARTAWVNWLKNYAVGYKVYIEKVGSANTGRILNNVTTTTSGVSVSFDKTYDAIKLSVPGAYNWTAFRADNSHDFKLHFDTSTGALVIDKTQYLANKDTADNSETASTGKYVNTRTGVNANTDPTDTATSADIYQYQLNEYYDINDATFFVLDGELYVYDELSGRQTRVTGGNGPTDKFTNSNWGQIKTKQAEIRVYNEAQQSSRNYRLDLKVGEPSNEKDILSLKVGDVTATRSGNSFTAALAEDAEKEQALTIQASANSSVMVNGQPYQADRKIDVSKEVTIVVTAENGSKTNYSLTTTFGTVTPPDPDKKPSDNYTDIPSGTIGEYVKKGIDLGIMIGSGNKFLPDNKITRRDFALMVARADVMAKDPSIKTAEAAQAELLKQYSGTPKFDDTKKLTDIYNAAIEYCNKKDIISGKPGNKFDPAGNVTRLETARMISGWAEVTDESKTTNVNNIKDWNKINWGKQYVNSVYAAGLMSGYGDASNSSFRPAQNLTRAEAARVIVSTFEKKTGAN